MAFLSSPSKAGAVQMRRRESALPPKRPTCNTHMPPEVELSPVGSLASQDPLLRGDHHRHQQLQHRIHEGRTPQGEGLEEGGGWEGVEGSQSQGQGSGIREEG